jgi:hypothetical protein
MIKSFARALLVSRTPVQCIATKQQKRLQEKKVEEHHVKTIGHLDSVVDQH